MCDFEWELSKENVQPLKGGRSVDVLNKVLSSQRSAAFQRKRQLLRQLDNLNGDIINNDNHNTELDIETFTHDPSSPPLRFSPSWRILFAKHSNHINSKLNLNGKLHAKLTNQYNSNESIDTIKNQSTIHSIYIEPNSDIIITDFTQLFILQCERILIFFGYFLILISFPFSLIFCLHVIRHYERAVIFRLGRLILNGPMGPGLLFTIPCFDIVERVDLRTFTFDVSTQEVLTKDSVTVTVEAVVYYRIFDPILSVVNVKNANHSTRLLAQTTLRNVLGTVDMSALLTEREHIANLMQETLDSATDTWGMKVERVEIKNVRLPIQLQRAMAAEAEATREARARIILAKGEHQASYSLKSAALEINDCPMALQLRYLHTLNKIACRKNSTIIFPLPIDWIYLSNNNLIPSNFSVKNFHGSLYNAQCPTANATNNTACNTTMTTKDNNDHRLS